MKFGIRPTELDKTPLAQARRQAQGYSKHRIFQSVPKKFTKTLV
jgi:hypothetical protein